MGISDGDFIMATAEDELGVATAISSAGKYIRFSISACIRYSVIRQYLF